MGCFKMSCFRHVHNMLCCILQIEERINIDTLEELKKAFQAADVDGSGQLELSEFKTLLKNQLNISYSKVRALFTLSLLL